MSLFRYPDNDQDFDRVIQFAKDIRRSNSGFWDAVEAQAWKNIYFFVGLHWLAETQRPWYWRPMAKTTTGVPRPTTNFIKPPVNDLASKLVAFKPPITWGPGSDQESDYVAASVADRVNTAIEKETEIHKHKAVGARTIALTANLFVVTGYSNSLETGTRFLQAERCLHCLQTSMPLDIQKAGNACPHCGSQEMQDVIELDTGMSGQVPTVNPRFEAGVDGSGQPVGVSYPRGQHTIELENVFTTRFDPECGRFHLTPYLLISRRRSRSWVVERCGEEFADSLSYGRGPDPFSVLFDSITFSSLGAGIPSSGGSDSENETVRVDRLWLRPNATKAPGGIYAEIIGDKIAERPNGKPICGPYPFHDERGTAMLNVAHLEFDQVPGRVLASTRCDDAVILNQEINELDYFIKLHHRRMANAVYTIPVGSNPTPITGDAGIYINYNPLATGHRPERLAGVSVPADIYMYRNIRKQEIDQVWGAFEVGRGQAPSGVSAYAALQLLDERAQQGQSNLFDNWALGWMEVARQQINIWREYADEQRTLSLGVGRWATKKFSQAEMTGGVDLSLELGMNRPTTLVAKAARIGQAIQQGLINVFDPQVRYRALRALGIPELLPNFNKDYERIGRIIDQILSARALEEMPIIPSEAGGPWAGGVPAMMPFDNHAIHLEALAEFIKDEAFEALEPWKQEGVMLLAQAHYEMLRADAMEQTSRAGQNAPRIGGRKPAGAEGSGGGRGGGGEEEEPPEGEQTVLDRERQGASPETMTGASANSMVAQ